MKTLRALFAAVVLTLCAVAPASATDYVGLQPSTGLNALPGTLESLGTAPVITSSTCGTPAVVGGPNAGVYTAGAVTTCTVVLTFPVAAKHGYNCFFVNRTTAADVVRQASSTTTSCTTNAETIVASDVLQFWAIAY